MLEVFTIGGGEYIVNVFNAVAAWTGGGGYKSLIKVVMVIGLIYSLMAVAFSMNVRAWLNWFLTATGIYLCLMVPTVQIKVTDRINPSLAPATVANVPLGLGVMASFTSQVGDYLTRTAETVFTMPSQLNYSTNGMIYGARLFDATRNFQIRDAEFATNLQQHFKQCVFGDIMLHHKSLTDLANSKDLWADLGPGSEARGQSWLERDPSGGGVGSAIVTCQQAYEMLSARWQPLIEAHAGLWGKEAYPRLSTALAAQKLKEDVPITNTAFTNASSDYTGTMRQMTAINAFMQARDAMAGGSGSAAIDTFATTRADIQARNTYNSIAYQAMSWVPILNIVLTVVFYAMFPVIFPLFLLPQTGVGSLRGYATGFFYLASWGPLYVILHMICMTKGEYAAQGVADGGVTLSTFAGIGAVNAETATIAGFLVMSVPFMAGALAKGAMSVSTQATSMLAPAQNAAEASALEQTTGNYAYGNVSYANSTSNMRQSNQYSDAPTYFSGSSMFTARMDNGATIASTASGAAVVDSTPAISKLPMGITTSAGYVAEQRQQASMLHREAESLRNDAATIRSHINGTRGANTISTEATSGTEASRGAQAGTSVENADRTTDSTFNGLDNRSANSQSQRLTKAHNRSAQYLDTVDAKLSASLGGSPHRGSPGAASPSPEGQSPSNGKGTGRLSGITSRVPGLGISKGYNLQQADRLDFGTQDQRGVEQTNSATDGTRNEHAASTNVSDSNGTYARNGVFSRQSRTVGSSFTREEAETLAQSYERRASAVEEKAAQLSNDATWAESHGMQISENLSQELQDWYRKEAANLPSGVEAPGLHEASLRADQRQIRDGLISKFFEQRRQGVYDLVRDRLQEPDMVQLRAPDVHNDRDVLNQHRGLGPAPMRQPSVDLSGAAEAKSIIAAGKVNIAAEQHAARNNRTGHVIAGSDLRGEVTKDLDRQFLNDPSMRK